MKFHSDSVWLTRLSAPFPAVVFAIYSRGTYCQAFAADCLCWLHLSGLPFGSGCLLIFAKYTLNQWSTTTQGLRGSCSSVSHYPSSALNKITDEYLAARFPVAVLPEDGGGKWREFCQINHISFFFSLGGNLSVCFGHISPHLLKTLTHYWGFSQNTGPCSWSLVEFGLASCFRASSTRSWIWFYGFFYAV